ncbi:MAG: MFS transporter, partial [Mariniphaga sp.]
SSWASRIPDIKTVLGMSDGLFGTVLLALPVGQFLMMPISGRLVTRYGSPHMLLFALPAYGLCLINIGFVSAIWQLAVGLFLFGLAGNLCNISINSQGIAVEKLYERSIMASFHGGWSLAGFTGALIGLVMVNLKVAPQWHFIVVVVLVWILLWLNHSFLIENKSEIRAGMPRPRFFSKPDGLLLQLGVIGFFSMASEGTMFDWSGIYFKDVVEAPASLVVLGYTSFMIMMAAGRFISDSLISRFGRQRLLQISGLMISAGLFTSVLFPRLVPSTIAFMIVGLGVSSIVPTVYSTAGNQNRVPPGIALATVSSVSFLGFLLGPPLIGYISELAGLRSSFAVVGLFGIGIALMVGRIRAFGYQPAEVGPAPVKSDDQAGAVQKVK